MKIKGSIIRIMENTLNRADSRLVNHGRRVAYLSYRVLRAHTDYSKKELRDFIVLGLLHDIGAYKTEDIDKLVEFETENVWEHSVYGYLFIKNFSPLRHLAPVLLFHHANCMEITHLHPKFRQAAQIIHVADRFDILSQSGRHMPEMFKRHFINREGSLFAPQVLNMFFQDNWENMLDNMDGDDEFNSLLYDGGFSEEEEKKFLEMLVLSIDFRSPLTVARTFTSRCVSQILMRHIEVAPEEAAYMHTAMLAHDLGNISLPPFILEKPGALSEDELDIMKNHVAVTREILEGNVDDTCLNLAIRHHERLDGSGYPEGLPGKELTAGQRIAAVADIFSSLAGPRANQHYISRDRLAQIMTDLTEQGMVDPLAVGILLDKYDDIMDEVDEKIRPIIDSYETMKGTYNTLLPLTAGFGIMSGRGEIEI